MNYTLNTTEKHERKTSVFSALKKIAPFLSHEKKNLIIALGAILITSITTLLAPVIIAHTVDSYIQTKDFHGVIVFSAILLSIFAIGLCSSYIQTKLMGGIGRRVLFNLRNGLFTKLQELPIAFFNQNKAGDLISRINNDTDQLNQFFSQALMQFVGSFFTIIGAGIFLIALNVKLGLATLIPALFVFIFTKCINGWVKSQNFKSLQTLGGMSAEIQESLNNFRVIVAFNRLDYFKEKFSVANNRNFSASVGAGLANNIFTPVYGLAANCAQLIVLAYGIFLIIHGSLTVGLLIGFLLYVNNFYNPLRQLASVWSSLQLALAGFDRISEVLNLSSDMPQIKTEKKMSDALLQFNNVSFGYPDGKIILKNINLAFEKGKTYALVGPTGGGKTTTASLMARLYDPTDGTISFEGSDIKSYPREELVKKIGFILQEPFLFSGSVRDNIVYGNAEYAHHSIEDLREILEQEHLSDLINQFDKGLETEVTTSGDSISLGQKQLIAFIRAVLRKPDILILDEATANIDTVTEQLLETILQKLPRDTTKVIIAHRLNTISAADAIYFVNGGEITLAGSMEDAVQMLLNGKRQS